MIEGQVTITYARLRSLEETISQQEKKLAERDAELREMEFRQKEVVIRHREWQLTDPYNKSNSYLDFIKEIYVEILEKTGFRYYKRMVTMNSSQIKHLIERIAEHGIHIVSEKETKSYVNLDDVKEELRTELSAKIRTEFSEQIAKASADREVLDKQLARKTAHQEQELKDREQKHQHAIDKLKYEYQQQIEDLEQRLADKKQQNLIESMEEKIRILEEKLKSNKPWWKFW